VFIRVQALLPDLPAPSGTLDLSKLRKSIKRLQSASLHLDTEKTVAEKKLKAILKKLCRHHSKCKRSRAYRQIADWVKRVFGVQPHHYVPLHHHADAWKEYLGPIDSLSLEESGHPHKFPIRKLIKAAIRVRKANQKIIAFERGFISAGGIKDREWYKHLGVAPGKWLGTLNRCIPSFAFTHSVIQDTVQLLSQL
jgi:N-acetylated-alpha-linked acidic dipeptidase